MKKFFLPIVLLLPLSFTYSQITITPSTPVNAVNSFIGTGVTVSNVTYQGVPNSLATFTGPSNMGISNGIIFGTGTSANVNNNASYFHSDGAVCPGDPDLQALSTNPVQDAAVLEFDFTAQADSITFEYVFSSEEYSDYVGSGFNDVFGFFVSGPGIAGTQNIAIIPGTALPVTINNVNNGYSTAGTVPSGPCMNCAYYNDNTNGAGATVCYDGLTVVLTARLGISICETYHIKLAVGNVGDGAFDSGVFLKANSFSSGYVNITPTGGVAYPNNISVYCPGDSVKLTASNATSWQWDTGDTTRSIWCSSPGVHSVIVYGVGGCFLFSQPYTVLEDNPTATITPSGLVTICPGDSAILTANSGIAYQWSNGATTQSITVFNSGNFTVIVTDTVGCDATSLPVTVNSGVATAVITPVGPTAICQGGTVTLSANNGSVYLWSNGATTQNISTALAGTYTVTVTQSGGCSAVSAPQNVTVSVPAASITPLGPTTFCQGSNVTLSANAGSSYLWSTGATTQNITTTTAGNYIVTVTDAGGCDTASAPVAITVNTAVANITVNGSLVLCPGQQASLSANAGNSYLWSNGATTQSITPSTAGNYTVTVTNFNNCTATSAPVAVSVSNPTATITPGGTTTLCPGNTVILNANAGNSYLWSNGSTTASITTGMAGTYTVTVTNADNCTAVSTPVVVTVTPPAASITPSGPTTFCQGGNVTLSANAGSSYLWSTGATTQNITTATAGAYVVTVTNANGCDTASAPVNIIVNTGTATITPAGSTTICPGNSVTLTANAGNSYLWSNGATTQSINAAVTGSYTVTVTNFNTCTAISTPVAVTVSNPSALITPGGSTTLCPGGNVTLSANPGTAYQWSNGSTASSINVTAAGTFTVTVTNADNCTAVSAQVTVAVSNPTAVITPQSQATFCQGDSVILSANSGSSYLWSNGATTQNVSILAAGNFTVTVTNIDGCTAVSAQQQVTVNSASVTISATGPTVFCPNSQVTLQASNGASFLWSNGATTQSITVNQNGNYQVTITDPNSCTAVSNIINTLVSLPAAVITPSGPTTICPNTTVTLSANTGSSYLWSNGSTDQSISVGQNGTFSAIVTDSIGCQATSNTLNVIVSIPQAVITPAGPTTFCDGDAVTLQANSGTAYQWSTGGNGQSVTISQAGTYTVEVTDTAGCKESSAPITVTVLYATATATPLGPTVFCEGDAVSITANAGLAYVWNSGATTQTIEALTSGNYFVTVTNNNGCTAVSSAIYVDVHAYPVIKFQSDTSLICETLKVKFTNQSVFEAGSTFSWNFGDGATSVEKDPFHYYSTAGSYAVILTITSPVGCVSSDTVDITVTYYPPPVARFKADPNYTTLVNSRIQFTDMSANAVRWYWNFGDGSTSGDPSPSHYYSAEGNYKVTLRIHSLADCVDEYSEEVYVAPFFIPNSFTPNKDGKNEVFFDAGHIVDVDKYEMLIWNRWGQLVFRTGSYQEPWSGIDQNGGESPEGMYVYQINVNTRSGQRLEYHGRVNLIR